MKQTTVWKAKILKVRCENPKSPNIRCARARIRRGFVLSSPNSRPTKQGRGVGSGMDEAADSSALLRRVEELQREKDEKQNALEVLIRRVDGLQYEMDEKVELVEVLTRRVEELQRERDELRKDIEQLCMQQAGPGYVSVATRMLSQRTAALEQDVENLQKKLNGCLRENQNLQEELAEAYRVKSQLAELHGAELSKNKDLEKQVRFFQSSVAQAFSERDISLMECEKAKEREEAVLKKFADFEERKREYQSAIDDQKHLNDDLQRKLTELKAQTESSLKASLEEEKESLKAKMAKLQSNLRMGLEIEQHLQRNARILEKRQALYDGFLRNGLSELQKFYKYQRAEIMKTLEEESSRLSKVAAEIQDKLSEICINTESEQPGDEMQCCDSSCKDVHVTSDVSPRTFTSLKSDSAADSNSISFDESKALAQALQEKMEALMLFSQEQERYLLEKQKDQIVIEDLQKKLSQVKDEKVKVLMELAKLKEEYLQLKGNSAVKEGHGTGDSSKAIPGHDQQGMLKTMLKRTSLRHWMRSSNIGHGSSDENDHSVCKEHSVDIASHQSHSIRHWHYLADTYMFSQTEGHIGLQAYDDVKSAGSLESTFEALNSLITEANLMKTALSTVLPVSWSGDSSDAITYEALCDPSDSPKSKSEKVDPLSSAGMEMVELLIFAAEVLKGSFLMKK
ncbi:paramyosin isoform X1 [Panicum miliaceum]|uniref:Paramyosin isoform X1 n=1 Tax=Panicum miliaceum TaxID=4540 RepID=A0A3L6TM29_PANMI|nr:paramyosin isoform X1 [Panicum miliaceum]